MRRCGEVRVVRSESQVALGIARDFLAMLICLSFATLLLFLWGEL